MKIAIQPQTTDLHAFRALRKVRDRTVDESTKTIIGKADAVPPPHEPGVLPKWLHEKEVNPIIVEEWACALNSIFSKEFSCCQHHRKILRQLLSLAQRRVGNRSNVCDH